MKNIIKAFLQVTLLASCMTVIAQQQAQFTQDMVNPFMINPALSGVEDYIDIKLGYRNQWSGSGASQIDGTPITRYITAHSSIGKTHHPRTRKGDYNNWHGIGGMFLNDEAGSIKTNSVLANYAYNMKITNGSGFGMNHKDGVRLAVGTFLGLTQFGLDKNELTFKTQNGESALSNQAFQQKLVPDASIGGMLYYQDKYFVGFSAMNLFGGTLSKSSTGDDSKFIQHYYFISKYKQKIGQDIFLIPSVVARFASPLPVSYDLNMRVDVKDTFFGGISYRNQDALAILLGVVYNNTFEFGYSYDITLSDIGQYSSGSHELIIGLRLQHKISER